MTEDKRNKLAQVTYILIIVTILGYLLYIAKPIVVPIIIGVFIAFLLYPFCKKLESWRFHRILAIVTAMTMFLGLISLVLLLFSNQFYLLFNNLEVFNNKLESSYYELVDWVTRFPLLGQNLDEILMEGGKQLFTFSKGFVSGTIVSSALFLAYFGMVLVYIFLFLLYRSAFRVFIISLFVPEKQDKVEAILYQSQKVILGYFKGVSISTMILGTLNTIGLYFIGIDYPALFGFFAAILTIVPYIGTTIGGTLPFIYALINYDEIWRAIAVVIFYQAIITFEGNYLQPKIVGKHASINPLIAIVVLIVGGFFWGIAGMILFIPLTAMLKLAFDNIEELKPYGYLLGSEFTVNQNRPKHSLAQAFKNIFQTHKNDKE
jgi:predicted PurR-regulated permease PerM